MWTAVYLAFGAGAGPTWRGYRFTVACTALWAVTVMAFNAVAGTNYGYLSHKPANGSLLDWFGPWPSYVVVEVALVAGMGPDDVAVDRRGTPPVPGPCLLFPSRARSGQRHRALSG